LLKFLIFIKRFNMIQAFGTIADELRSTGFYRGAGAISSEIIENLKKEILIMEAKDYSTQNLLSNAVYLSDQSATRVSHAMMVSLDRKSPFPEVPLRGVGVSTLINTHHRILEAFTQEKVSESARVMFNFQRYFAGSKPVAEHFDGHYLHYQKNSGVEFQLLEGLLPSLVIVVTLENENTGPIQGTYLRDCYTGQEYSTESQPGDLLVFDNIRFRHAVPELKKPRLMVGLRCFDTAAHHFLASQPEDSYIPLPDRNNPGFVKYCSEDTCHQILKDYYANVWPEHSKNIFKEGAVF
jgi:hypothetical protein